MVESKDGFRVTVDRKLKHDLPELIIPIHVPIFRSSDLFQALSSGVLLAYVFREVWRKGGLGCLDEGAGSYLEMHCKV